MDLKLAEQRLAQEFGDGVRRRRKALGLTQEDLAAMIGTNRRFVSELERGKGTSYIGPALAAAEALGVRLSSLFEERPRTTSKLPEV